MTLIGAAKLVCWKMNGFSLNTHEGGLTQRPRKRIAARRLVSMKGGCAR